MEITEKQFSIKHFQRFLPINKDVELYNYVYTQIKENAFLLLDDLMNFDGGEEMVRYLDGKTKDEKIVFLRNCKIDASARTVDFIKDTEDGWPISYLTIDLDVPLEIQVKHNIIPMFKTKTNK